MSDDTALPAGTSGEPTPPPTVRRLGEGVPYADGAEDRLLAIMQEATDRSSGSDELDAHIEDWPTRYHLSHQRANLLRPLRFGPGLRVLDVGAGTGSPARYLGETGAEVLALEGSMARARVAAWRCADLADVEVACGTIDDLPPDERFDVVCIIGVLEYSVAEIGGGAGAAHLLAAAAARLRPGGAVVLAIENQLGLKYLLGGSEDHRGQPWVGIEGYPGPPGPRTWSRAALRSMLADAGLVEQTWLAPYPDYKLPVAVVHEDLLAAPDAADVVSQLVPRPVSFADGPPARLGDARAAHRTFLEAGLGLDVASSFLVVAAPERTGVDRLVPDDALAWLYGAHRRRQWRRARTLTRARELTTDRRDEAQQDWLRQDPGPPSRPYLVGETLADRAERAVRAHDRDGLRTVLEQWWDLLAGLAAPRIPEAGEPVHPFLPAWATRTLPDRYLDVGLGNFVLTGDGVELIDDEWRTSGPVSLDLVVLRVLWGLAHEVVTSGISHPWSEEATVEQVFRDLLEAVPVEVPGDPVDALTEAEVALQVLVTGLRPDDVRGDWMLRERTGLHVRPDRQLVHELQAARARVAELQGEADHLRAELAATLPRQVWRGVRRVLGRARRRGAG